MSDELGDMDLDSVLDDEALTVETVSADISEEDLEEIACIDLGGGLENEVVQKSVSMEPLTNDATALLSAGIPVGSVLQRSLEDPTLEDPLLESIKNDDPIPTIFSHVLQEIAEEICYLKAYRKENWSLDQDFSDVSAKRIKMLKSLVESLVEREKLKSSKTSGKVDFHSKNFENVFGHFLTIIKETFGKVSVPKQYEDIFFTQLAKDLDGFERAAEKIYYGKK